MDWKEYVERTNDTAIYPTKFALSYLVLGLASEVSEVVTKCLPFMPETDVKVTLAAVARLSDELSLLKKRIRGDHGKELNLGRRADEFVALQEYAGAIKKEFGDVAWYLAQLSELMGGEDILEANIAKLAKRKEENKLQGDGDDR